MKSGGLGTLQFYNLKLITLGRGQDEAANIIIILTSRDQFSANAQINGRQKLCQPQINLSEIKSRRNKIEGKSGPIQNDAWGSVIIIFLVWNVFRHFT